MAGFLATGAGVLAADIAPVEPIPTWSGFHIGVGGGYGAALHDGFLDVEGTVSIDDDEDEFFNSLFFDDMGDESWLGTVEAGFDWDFGGGFVLGIFGDYTFTNFKSEAGDFLCEDGGPADCLGKAFEVEVDDIWTVGGRLGWASSEQTLWYVLGGYSQGKVQANAAIFGQEDADDDTTGFGERFFGDDNWEGGFTVGAGVETMWDNVSLKLEYRYTDLGSVGSFFSTDDGDTTIAIDILDQGCDADCIEITESEHDYDTHIHTIRAVLAWRFNWGL
jgi:outer membrane immunogenic protein